MSKLRYVRLSIFLGAFLISSPYLPGADFTWIGTGPGAELRDQFNWSPTGIPVSSDIGIFNGGGSTSPSLNSDSLDPGTFSFTANQTYTFSLTNGGDLGFEIQGITNTGGAKQIFNVDTSSSIFFDNSAMADNNSGLTSYNLSTNGLLEFYVLSSASKAKITENASGLAFFDSSTASKSTIDAENLSFISFFQTTTADKSKINLNNSSLFFDEQSTAGSAKVTAQNNSNITFENLATADHITIEGKATQVQFQDGTTAANAKINLKEASSLSFQDTATADLAVINLDETAMEFRDSSTASEAKLDLTKSSLIFHDNSLANAASIEADKSSIQFLDLSDAGVAKIQLNKSSLQFFDTSTADSSTIQAQESSIEFFDSSVGAIADIALHKSALTFNQDNTLGTLTSDSSSVIDISNIELTIGSSNNDMKIAGKIIGTDASIFQKVGTGTLKLTGKNSAFGGNTNVNAGDLDLEGSLGGQITVNTGAILSGTGHANNVAVEAGATISPGNSSMGLHDIGTFHVDGDYVQQASSFYEVQVNADGSSDLIKVKGSADLLGGTVDVTSPNKDYIIDKTYTILHADQGVTGSFSNLIFSDNIFLKGILSQNRDNVFLEFTTQFAKFANTRNRKEVAKQLDSIKNPSKGLERVLQNLIQLSPDRFENALDQLGGEQYTNLLYIAQESAQHFIRRIDDWLIIRRVANPCEICPCEIIFWSDGEWGRRFQEGDGNAHGYELSEWNVNLGAHLDLSACLSLGLAVTYEEDHIDFNIDGHGKSYTTLAALYGAYYDPCYYFISNLIGGYTHNTVTRLIDFRKIDLKANSSPKIYQIAFYNELGTNLLCGCTSFQPFLGLEYEYLHRGSFDENNNPVGLNVDERSVNTGLSRLGLRIEREWLSCITIGGDVAWKYRFNFAKDRIHAHFNDFGREFTIEGVDQRYNSIEGALYADVKLMDRVSIFGEISGERWSRFSSFDFTGGIAATW